MHVDDVHTYVWCVCVRVRVCVQSFFKGSAVKNESNGKDARKI